MANSEIVVIGCGTIGAPLAVAFAAKGVVVEGVDINAERVRQLITGTLARDDDRLNPELVKAVQSERLSFSTKLKPAAHARVFVIAAPTPIDADQRYDGQMLKAAVAAVAAVARDGDLVAIRSTTPIGTLRGLATTTATSGRRLLWAACPDRSVAGRSLSDQYSVPHVVGGLDDASASAASRLFKRLGEVIQVTSPEAAEAIKLFSNIQRDVLFALANQFALVCDVSCVNFEEVRAAGAAGFSRSILARAGPVGGPCLSKDVFLLAEGAEAAGADIAMLRAARQLNAGLAEQIASRIIHDLAAADEGGSPAVAVLGLAFKGAPPVRDQSYAFGARLVQVLRERAPNLDLRSWDPASDPNSATAAAAVAGARVVVLANEHIALANWNVLKGAAAGAVIYDMCGVLTQPVQADVVLRRFGQGASAIT